MARPTTGPPTAPHTRTTGKNSTQDGPDTPPALVTTPDTQVIRPSSNKAARCRRRRDDESATLGSPTRCASVMALTVAPMPHPANANGWTRSTPLSKRADSAAAAAIRNKPPTAKNLRTPPPQERGGGERG